MAGGDISEELKGLKINESQDINILLLGETGVGKSTFINSIANYLNYKSFKKASKAENLLVLIPSVITVTNEKFEQVTLTIGSDNNEFQEIGAAGTQDVKTYVFPIGDGKARLRLIDTPGMGDPRGVEQDDINCENILSYLSQLKELHAICFLMRPTTTRKTILFDYCVKQILSRLEKSASKNIVFIFTNTRGSNYSPGDTLPCLRTIIEEIKSKPPHVDIPLKANIFSVDNEAFRFLVAMKNEIKFNKEIEQRFIESWNNSSRECWSLIHYILGDASRDPLKPHQLLNTISINEARRIIVQLSQPLADISQLIHDNLRILEKHKRNLKMDNQSLDELKQKLYIPLIKLEVTQLTQPVTVCTSSKCADVVQIGELKQWHYKQRCHDPCYLTNVTKDIVGDANLMRCAAMIGRICQKCTCDYSVHMHVYYMTKPVNDKIIDNVVQGNIVRKEQALAESQRLIQEIDRRKSELEEERDVIIKSTAQFAHFLQHNAISPFNDSYKAYIEYLITREKSLGRNGDPEGIQNLEQLLYRYKVIKAAFENSFNFSQQHGLDTVLNSPPVTAEIVLNTIHQLYRLKHNGKKIHELFKKQKNSRKTEYDKSCEYVHPKSSDLSQTESTKEYKQKKDKKEDGKSKDGKKKSKDGRTTDDERQNKNKNFRPRQKNVSHSTGFTRDPPPPYPGARYDNSKNFQRPHNKQAEPNVVVKVELTQPSKNPNISENTASRRSHNTFQGQPVNYGYRPQGPYAGPPQAFYNEPNRGVYYNEPRGAYQSHQYHGPGGNPNYQNQSYGPPQSQYQRPPYNPHYGPQAEYYGPPRQDHYYAPPYQNDPYGPPQSQEYHQAHGSLPHPGSYQKHYGTHSGRPQQRGRGQSKSKSKPRYNKDKKSGNEHSNRSSSDSSSD